MSGVLLQWETWVYGLVAGFVGGGANAVVASVTVSAIAPDKFNFTTQLHNFLMLIGITFLASGLLSAMAYLAKSPLPPVVTTVVKQQDIAPTPQGGVSIKTVETTKETK